MKTLRKAGIERHQVKLITGHKSDKSIEHYDNELDEEDATHYSNILTGGSSTITKDHCQSNHSQQDTVAVEPRLLLQNCTININMTPTASPPRKFRRILPLPESDSSQENQ